MALLSEEDLGIIMNAVHKYVNKYFDGNFIDYYDMFGIDRNCPANMILETFKSKRFHILFHPDMVANVPEHLKPYFNNVCGFYIDFRAICEHSYKKREYDAELDKYNRKFSADATINMDSTYESEENKIKNNKKILFNEFGRFVLPTMAKYGKKNAIQAIMNYLNVGSLKSFTRTSRIPSCREMIANIDRRVLLELIQETYKTSSITEVAPLIFEDIITEGCALVGNAALDTYEKYGYHQTKGAIEHFMMENKINYFTNKNGARDDLELGEITFSTLPYLLAFELNLDNYLDNPAHAKLNSGYVIDEYMKIIEQRIVQRKSASYKQ